jgi:hypothetical protein
MAAISAAIGASNNGRTAAHESSSNASRGVNFDLLVQTLATDSHIPDAKNNDVLADSVERQEQATNARETKRHRDHTSVTAGITSFATATQRTGLQSPGPRPPGPPSQLEVHVNDNAGTSLYRWTGHQQPHGPHPHTSKQQRPWPRGSLHNPKPAPRPWPRETTKPVGATSQRLYQASKLERLSPRSLLSRWN